MNFVKQSRRALDLVDDDPAPVSRGNQFTKPSRIRQKLRLQARVR